MICYLFHFVYKLCELNIASTLNETHIDQLFHTTHEVAVKARYFVNEVSPIDKEPRLCYEAICPQGKYV